MLVVAAFLAGLATWVALLPRSRVPRLLVRRPSTSPSGFRPSRSASARIACLGAGLATFVVIGGWPGVLACCIVTGIGPVLLGRLESTKVRAEREALQRQAPQVADLLSSCLASGATPQAGIDAVCIAMGPPVSEHLAPLSAALRLGADPETAWMSLAKESSLAPLARAVTRSIASGAPLAQTLAHVAEDLRGESRARAESAARAAGVRAVAPLAACFLPAFLLLGVVPIVASLALPMIQAWFGGSST